LPNSHALLGSGRR